MEWSVGAPVWFVPGGAAAGLPGAPPPVPLPGEVLEWHRPSNVVVVKAVISGKPQTFAIQLSSPSAGDAAVETAPDGSTISLAPPPLRPREPLGACGVDDMTRLADLHEAALLWNLKIRYDQGLFYTYAGSVLVSVNPLRAMGALYALDVARKYAEAPALAPNLPPHLFATAAAARNALPRPQAILVSGESGSGKTEAAKLAVQFLAAVAPAPAGRAPVSEQILEAAPLLEALGNAATPRNDNSSRFGKLLELYFRGDALAGARVKHYLLEKSRIVTQAPGERNYHIFYELLEGMEEEKKKEYGLQDADTYFYLNQGGSGGSGGSSHDWSALCRAMQVLGIEDAERESAVKVLAAVLHLGNIYFHRRQLRHGQEGVQLGGGAEVRWAAHLLKIDSADLARALTTRVTTARGERMRSPLPIDRALDARDAFAKALYAGLFNWLVARINSAVHRSGLQDAQRVCILDIFGFENLDENSFEQLCINYANESLQHYFNRHIFKLEQQEYQKERLEWTNLTWVDNSPVIYLLSKKPVGILHLLDDESNFPRASDTSFLEKCHYNHALNELYSRPRIGAKEFGVRHYAGQVWYSVEGFLDKNRDALRPEVIELLAESSLPLVNGIAKSLAFPGQSGAPGGSQHHNPDPRLHTIKPRTPTVAARFSDSLHQLLESMSYCQPWFIRCVKPNNDKAPSKFDMPCVLTQLRYLGMLDTIKIRQMGYPVRVPFKEFVETFRCLLPANASRSGPPRELCTEILCTVEPTGAAGPDYQLGASRIWVRETVWKRLGAARANRRSAAANTITAAAARYLHRKHFHAMRNSAVTIQAWWRGAAQRRKFVKVRRGVVALQAVTRGRRARRRYKAMRRRRITPAPPRTTAPRNVKSVAQHVNVAVKNETHQRIDDRRISHDDSNNNGIQQLEVPAELAFIFSKLDDWQPPHSERNFIKVVGEVMNNDESLEIPGDLDQFSFSKFCSVYCQGGAPKNGQPITQPLLTKASVREQDYTDALSINKLIARWCNDSSLWSSPTKEKVLADYIVQKALSSKGLRDELLVQLCCRADSASDGEPSGERAWLLIAHCLAAFAPGPVFYKYLLQLIRSRAPQRWRSALLELCVRSAELSGANGHAVVRRAPPTQLELRAFRSSSRTALPLHLPNGAIVMVSVGAWTRCGTAAAIALATSAASAGSQSSNTAGWTIVLEHNGRITESTGSDYILDLIGELEVCPALPVLRPSRVAPVPPGHSAHSGPSLSVARNSPSARSSPAPVPVPPPAPVAPQAHHSPKRPQVPPPEPPKHTPASRTPPIPSARNESLPSSSAPVKKTSTSETPKWKSSPVTAKLQRTGHERLERVSENLISNVSHSRKISHDVLSRDSALNERYFDPEAAEKMRSRSLDNLLGVESSAPPQANLADLGLSQSRLNDRYHSHDQIVATSQEASSTGDYIIKQEIEFEYPDINSSIGKSNKGTPRYIKSQYAGKRAPAGSHSSKAYIEKNSEFSGIRSSAMSDTSEAPSLASHVRRVRVPSQASDVDQFLDELFSPVLDANIDELSDARSLAASIKGGAGAPSTPNDKKDAFGIFVDTLYSGCINEDDLALFPNASQLEKAIKGGGTREVEVKVQQPAEKRNGSSADSVDNYITELFDPIFLNDSLKRLTDKDDLVGAIKGGGTASHQSSSAGPSSFNLTQQTALYNMPDYRHNHNNLQRAFLQNAMAQNLQIQQQLLAQNQALQSLLSQEGEGETSSRASPARKSSFTKNNMDFKSRKMSIEAAQDTPRNISSGVPPPPPMPPPLEVSDPSEVRPFLDPYGRAKTVRIGKWRWPPPQGTAQENGEDFIQFKLRQNQRKSTPQSRPSTGSPPLISPGNESMMSEREEFEIESTQVSPKRLSVSGTTSQTAGGRRSFDIAPRKPSPGSIGKLKLSSEMRMRLERVTANHSVRSASSETEAPRKLEDARRMMLERQLAGGAGGGGGRAPPPVGAPPPPHAPPPPPPPPMPRGEPPPAPPQPQDAPRFLQMRQDRDTFGAHHNREGRHSQDFRENWDVGRYGLEDFRQRERGEYHRYTVMDDEDRRDSRARSNSWDREIVSSKRLDSEENERMLRHRRMSPQKWDKDSNSEVFGKHSEQAYSSRDGSERYEMQLEESITLMSENYEPSERKSVSPYNHGHDHHSKFNAIKETFSGHKYQENGERKNSREMLMGKSYEPYRNDSKYHRGEKDLDRPTFKTHMAQKERDRKIEAERKQSVSTYGTDMTDRNERDIPTPNIVIQPPSGSHLTYNRVPWRLYVKKEVFTPNENYNDPAILDLLFHQIVSDVIKDSDGGAGHPTASERRGAVELLRASGVQLPPNQSGNATNLLTGMSPAAKHHVKRQLVEMARSWNSYFTNEPAAENTSHHNGHAKVEEEIEPWQGRRRRLTHQNGENMTHAIIRQFTQQMPEDMTNRAVRSYDAIQTRFAAVMRDNWLRLRRIERAPSADSLANSSDDSGAPSDSSESGADSRHTRTTDIASIGDASKIELDTTYLEQSHKQCDFKDCTFKKISDTKSWISKCKPSERKHVTNGKECLIKSEKKEAEFIKHETIDKITIKEKEIPKTKTKENTNGRHDQKERENEREREREDRASSSPNQRKQSSITSSASSGHMETIMEESTEPKVSVREILARFEHMTEKTESQQQSQHQQQQQASPSRAQSPPLASHAADVGAGAGGAAAPLRPSLSSAPTAAPRDSPHQPRRHVADGRHPLLQFALHHFNHTPELELLKMDGAGGGAAGMRGKAKRNEWTWKQQTDVVKWQAAALRAPLLRLPAALAPLALRAFDCARAYCGDHREPALTELKCVYTVLMHCHAHPQLRDEVYCQLMKQTTTNRSPNPESAQRAWRLLSIMAAYFDCSDTLRPYLREYLNGAAGDRRRACAGCAAVCAWNLRRTQRYGGRKNVPGVEELTAVSAGRSARRQLCRLPGGAERAVHARQATVAADVVDELCALLGVLNPAERSEFSLYCIVAGEALSMPLASDEYILDVTTELQRSQQPFYLIFCRSVWHFPLKIDAPPLYTEVLFNQVAPDYLEGLLLELGSGAVMNGNSGMTNGHSPNGGGNEDMALSQTAVRDIAMVAALLHKAADLDHQPQAKEVKFLVPKPVWWWGGARWAGLVAEHWPNVQMLPSHHAKIKVLQVLSRWPLFGSSFFAVRRVSGGTGPITNGASPGAEWREHVLALNRRGLHLLDPHTHRAAQHWPFDEIISTRKVRSEDGTLFLDLKCGSLLQQRVTRLQAEQAHEIARLVKQYVSLQRDHGQNGEAQLDDS